MKITDFIELVDEIAGDIPDSGYPDVDYFIRLMKEDRQLALIVRGVMQDCYSYGYNKGYDKGYRDGYSDGRYDEWLDLGAL